MIERIFKGEAQGVLCWKLDRLARNPIDGGQISWLLQQGNIKHIQTHERGYFPDDNVLLMSFEFGMANQFIRDLSVNTERGLRQKAERGWYPTFATLGYMHNPVKRKGEKEDKRDEKMKTPNAKKSEYRSYGIDVHSEEDEGEDAQEHCDMEQPFHISRDVFRGFKKREKNQSI
jgi:DNA invertase Pin-like site-specific DNA recombinase